MTGKEPDDGNTNGHAMTKTTNSGAETAADPGVQRTDTPTLATAEGYDPGTDLVHLRIRRPGDTTGRAVAGEMERRVSVPLSDVLREVADAEMRQGLEDELEDNPPAGAG